jgi:NAD(P)-dependent dehydrogenase (short-subunit alcohol dehydrogenase family)
MDVKSLFDLTGKTAVITGAGGALCGTMAGALAQVGVKAAVLDISMEKAEETAAGIRKNGGQAQSFAADVLNEDSLAAVRDEIGKLWGAPDILINGAGGNHPRGSAFFEFAEPEHFDDDRPGGDGRDGGDRPELATVFDLPFEGFSSTFSLNFYGTFLASKAFGREMAKRGSGIIVNISSMSAFTPLTKVGAYSAAKAAVSNFTRWLAVHLSHTGVRVNAIAPGFFMTEQLRFLHINQETGEYTPRAKSVIAHTPMGRYGEPEELVGTLIWLCSEASKFVTGTVIPVDGGFSAYAI